MALYYGSHCSYLFRKVFFEIRDCHDVHQGHHQSHNFGFKPNIEFAIKLYGSE